jgi:TonB dependent receptor/TonB-dependent Receptor Plug Domain
MHPRSNPGLDRSVACAAAIGAAALAIAVLWPAPAVADGTYLGRRLAGVLGEIGGPTLRLVYSSEIVPSRLRVLVEPTATDGPALLEQLLAPHGLGAEHVGGIVYAVARKERAHESPDPTPAPPVAMSIEEIVVASSRYRLADDAPVERTFLTQAEVEALPRLADDSLKAVHRVPGAASNGLSGLAYMRGGEQSETLVVFDGLPMYEPFHLRLLTGPTSVLDPRVLDSLDVYAGGFTAEFGDRMSAVIDARSTHPDTERRYETGLSVFHANALAAERFADDRGQWLVSVRRSNLDVVADMAKSEIGRATYFDGFGRLDWRFSDTTRGSVHTLLASDRSSLNNDEATEFVDAQYSNSYVWGTIEHQWTPALCGSLLLSYSDVTADRQGTVEDPGRREGFVADDRAYHVFGAKLDGSYTNSRWLHRAGLEFRSLSARYRYASRIEFAPGYPFPGDPGGTVERALAPSPSGDHTAAYATSRLRLTERLAMELGVRWDEQTYGADSDEQFAPRFNLVFNATDSTRLRASWGEFQQAQSINELQVEDGVEEFQPTQRVETAILGLERALPGELALRVEAYRKRYGRPEARYENMFAPLSLLPELRWDRARIAPDSALASGFEVLLSRKSASAWNGWLNYAWSSVEDREDGVETPRSWDQAHAFGGGLTWTSDPWVATLAATYHSGWPTTSVRLAEPLVDETPEVLIGPRNDSRLQDYLSIDARVSRRFRLRRGELDAYFEVTNLTNRSNPCCVEYQVTETAPPTLVRDNDHWLPLLPSVGVLWRY